jgi:hypothetical protein
MDQLPKLWIHRQPKIDRNSDDNNGRRNGKSDPWPEIEKGLPHISGREPLPPSSAPRVPSFSMLDCGVND